MPRGRNWIKKHVRRHVGGCFDRDRDCRHDHARKDEEFLESGDPPRLVYLFVHRTPPDFDCGPVERDFISQSNLLQCKS